jgi:hypothetical protein
VQVLITCEVSRLIHSWYIKFYGTVICR